MALEELSIEKGHRYAGKTLREIVFPHQSLVILIRKADGSVEIPRGDSLVSEGDILVLSTYQEALEEHV